MKKTEIAFVLIAVPSIIITYMNIGVLGILQGAFSTIILGLVVLALIKVFKELLK